MPLSNDTVGKKFGFLAYHLAVLSFTFLPANWLSFI